MWKVGKTERWKLSKEIIEIFKEFDGNNVLDSYCISAVFAFYCSRLYTVETKSKIEAILMDQKEESKRFGFYISNFIAVFGIINYILLLILN